MSARDIFALIEEFKDEHRESGEPEAMAQLGLCLAVAGAEALVEDKGDEAAAAALDQIAARIRRGEFTPTFIGQTQVN